MLSKLAYLKAFTWRNIRTFCREGVPTWPPIQTFSVRCGWKWRGRAWRNTCLLRRSEIGKRFRSIKRVWGWLIRQNNWDFGDLMSLFMGFDSYNGICIYIYIFRWFYFRSLGKWIVIVQIIIFWCVTIGEWCGYCTNNHWQSWGYLTGNDGIIIGFKWG